MGTEEQTKKQTPQQPTVYHSLKGSLRAGQRYVTTPSSVADPATTTAMMIRRDTAPVTSSSVGKEAFRLLRHATSLPALFRTHPTPMESTPSPPRACEEGSRPLRRTSEGFLSTCRRLRGWWGCCCRRRRRRPSMAVAGIGVMGMILLLLLLRSSLLSLLAWGLFWTAFITLDAFVLWYVVQLVLVEFIHHEHGE